MADTPTWAELDASPLAQLSAEQRRLLHKTNDPRFRAFWADCFAAYSASLKSELDGAAFSEAFLRVFDTYEPTHIQQFSTYLRSAVKHAQSRSHEGEQETPRAFGRETARKVKKAQEYMQRCGLSAEKVCADPELEQLVADIAGVGAKTLHAALCGKQQMLSLDAEDGALMEWIATPSGNVAAELEQEEPFSVLHRCVSLMDLKQKEAYGKKDGPLWSSELLGYLRCEEKQPLEENWPERLARCDDLRPLEADNCLWGTLLLREYVAYTICPPYAQHTPRELEHAAQNRLKDLECLPHQDRTVAQYLHISKSAVSQRKKTWKKNLKAMLSAAREKN